MSLSHERLGVNAKFGPWASTTATRSCTQEASMARSRNFAEGRARSPLKVRAGERGPFPERHARASYRLVRIPRSALTMASSRARLVNYQNTKRAKPQILSEGGVFRSYWRPLDKGSSPKWAKTKIPLLAIKRFFILLNQMGFPKALFSDSSYLGGSSYAQPTFTRYPSALSGSF